VACLLVCAAVMFFALVPAARAAPVALADDLAATHVALAGSEVLVARELRDGSVALDAVALNGGARRSVLSVSSPSGWDETMLVASPQRVGFVIQRGSGGTVEWRLYSGPPSGPLELVYRVTGHHGPMWMPEHVDVDGDRLLLVEGQEFDSAVRARVLEPGFGLVPVAWAGARLVPVALAGEHAAALVVDRSGEWRVDRVALVDRVTGAEQAALPTVPGNVPAPVDVDLTAGGQIVAELGSKLSIASPTEAPRPILDSHNLDMPRFAGAGIAALETARTVTWPVLLAPDKTRTRLGDPTGYITEFAADDHGVAWLANGCLRYAAIAGPPPAAPATDPCPTTEIGLYMNNDPRLRGREIRVPVLCINAPDDVCRGTLLIRHRGRIVGRGRFAIPVGRRPKIDVRLTRRGLDLVHGRNPVMRIGARIPNGRIGPSRGVTELLVHVP
jgi:hypothetical protein